MRGDQFVSAQWKIDRTGWAKGPWDDEPDRVQWTTRAGYTGLVARNDFGALCGYVGVLVGHPAYGKDVDDLGRLSAHGGINYVLHLATPEDIYWIGFDCQHAWDLAPGQDAFLRAWRIRLPTRDRKYRDLAYVRKEVDELAQQLKVFAEMALISPSTDRPSSVS